MTKRHTDIFCNEPGCNKKGFPCIEPMSIGRREGLHDLILLFKRRTWRVLLHETWKWLRWGTTEVITYYCSSHCEENGFCYVCGQFWSGADIHFDFSGTGLCSNCKDEFDDWRDSEYDEDENEWDDILAYGPGGDYE